MRLFRRGVDGDGSRYWHFWCPGCDHLHQVSERWEVTEHDDGTLTVSPSILVTRPGTPDRCHSFLRSGVWEFLGDCTHALANQQTPMVPLPEWLQDPEK